MVTAGSTNFRTRFAPSPNGLLHLGHAYAVLQAYDAAQAADGVFHLRIEDIDGARSRAPFVEAILADLAWLGVNWAQPVVFQSERVATYRTAFDALAADRLLYPCFCTRAAIAEALRARPVRHGPDGPVYPGTCRALDAESRAARLSDPTTPPQWRLDMTAAVARSGPLQWFDEVAGVQQAAPEAFGDVVLWRKDAPASYHLAATLDDAAMGIDHVVRGMDLFAYSSLHRLLQALLGLPVPVWRHHRLLVDDSGQKFAKSRRSPALRDMRVAGVDGRALAMDLRASRFPSGIFLQRS